MRFFTKRNQTESAARIQRKPAGKTLGHPKDGKRYIALGIVLWLLAFAFIFPMVMTFADSFMSETEIAQNYGTVNPDTEDGRDYADLDLIPDIVTPDQYYSILIGNTGYLMMFWNSVLLTAPIIAGQVAIGALAAYAFSAFQFKGRSILFAVYLITMLMPFQVTLVPNYLMADALGILGKYSSIIFPGIFATFGVFLLRQFMVNIPKETIEAAKMDGAGHMRIFFRVVLPLCKPALASLVILSFIDNWGMVEQPLVFLKNANMQPLSLYLSRINEGSLGIAFAASALYMLPIILIFLAGERYLVEGIQLTNFKDSI
jgi:multiple sugar transport system permease protein